MATPIISSINTFLGPVGQPIVINGENFVLDQTQVYFGSIPLNIKKIRANNIDTGYCDEIIAIITEECSGSDKIKVVTPEGEFTWPEDYTVGIPTNVPQVNGVGNHVAIPSLVYINGVEFVKDQTTVNYDGNTINVWVYTPNEGSFTKTNESDVVTSLTLTTPNGSTNWLSVD